MSSSRPSVAVTDSVTDLNVVYPQVFKLLVKARSNEDFKYQLWMLNLLQLIQYIGRRAVGLMRPLK